MNLREHGQLLEDKRKEITAWMKQKRAEVPIPIYGSVDVRDAGWKIGVVDANHFPLDSTTSPKRTSKNSPTCSKTMSIVPIRRAHGFTSIQKPHAKPRVRGKHRQHQIHD